MACNSNIDTISKVIRNIATEHGLSVISVNINYVQDSYVMLFGKEGSARKIRVFGTYSSDAINVVIYSDNMDGIIFSDKYPCYSKLHSLIDVVEVYDRGFDAAKLFV